MQFLLTFLLQILLDESAAIAELHQDAKTQTFFAELTESLVMGIIGDHVFSTLKGFYSQGIFYLATILFPKIFYRGPVAGYKTARFACTVNLAENAGGPIRVSRVGTALG